MPDAYRQASEERDRAHLAIEKAIEDARSERLAAERRKRPRAVWAPVLAGVACGGLAFAFTGHLVVAAVGTLFGAGGVLLTRTMDRLRPHDDGPPLRHD